MPGIADRKKEPDTVGTDEGLIDFPIPTEASSVKSQWGPGVWAGPGFGRRGIHGQPLSANLYSVPTPPQALCWLVDMKGHSPAFGELTLPNFDSMHKVLVHHFSSKACF